MPARLNHVAVFVAAVVFFLWGWLWFTIFSAPWKALVGNIPTNTSPAIFIESFVLGWIMSYAVGIALTNHEHPQPARHGVEFGLFMGIGLIATMMLNGFLYEGKPVALWAIDAGYAVTGLAIIGAIVSGWRRKVSA
jgi:hypothetical protein